MHCNFNEAYGDPGRDYIESTNVMPLAEYGVREADPATDLVVLCANCHRIVHRKAGVCLSLGGLRALIDGARAASGRPPLWTGSGAPCNLFGVCGSEHFC